MFEKKDKKLELVKEMLGTRNAYIESVKDIDLTEDERTLLMRASSQIKKENPNSAVIAKAYAILIDKIIEEEEEDISKIQLAKDYAEEHASAIGESIGDTSKKAFDESSKIVNDVKNKIVENAPAMGEAIAHASKKASNKTIAITNSVKELIVETAPIVEENLKKASKIAMDESEKIIEKTKQTKKLNFKYVQIAILIGILFLVFKSFSINETNNTSDVRVEKLKISCSDDVVEKLVNKLALNEMDTRVNGLIYNTNLGVMRFAIEDANYALMNVKSITLTSIYTTRRDNGVGRVECSGVVNVMSGKHFIPAHVEYNAQLNDYGTNVQVQLTSLQFTNKWITQ